MIHYIKGRLIESLPGLAILETNGIGYQLHIPENSAAYLAKPGEEMRFYTAMIVREDDISLYGFTERDSLSMFRKLMTVSGVGAKAALAVLSAMPLSELSRAIVFEDVAALTRANGIGKKTAQRIVLDLKEKIDVTETGVSAPDTDVAAGSAKEEAIHALIYLGYTKSEAMTAMIGITDPDLTAEEYIKKALAQK
ncbi:MAG TPA: Holliday junction branch migration protein RuvA [Bacillota bacterium]|jgi:Holliday junction DNA helicase RuvA|nr:Holliday junction branch migration protein RuvA [Bacillota bacterium]